MVAFARRRGLVFNDRSTPYTALLNGCIARRARFTDLGVTALFTARAGCIARRTPRGMNIRENKPTVQMVAARVIGVKLACSPRHPPSTGHRSPYGDVTDADEYSPRARALSTSPRWPLTPQYVRLSQRLRCRLRGADQAVPKGLSMM